MDFHSSKHLAFTKVIIKLTDSSGGSGFYKISYAESRDLKITSLFYTEKIDRSCLVIITGTYVTAYVYDVELQFVMIDLGTSLHIMPLRMPKQCGPSKQNR